MEMLMELDGEVW